MGNKRGVWNIFFPHFTVMIASLKVKGGETSATLQRVNNTRRVGDGPGCIHALTIEWCKINAQTILLPGLAAGYQYDIIRTGVPNGGLLNNACTE